MMFHCLFMVRVSPREMFQKTMLSKTATIFLSGVVAPEDSL